MYTLAAGTCWVKRNQDGKCKHPMERNVTKETCCSYGSDVGYSDKEMNEFEYFFATALGDGTTCSSCIGNEIDPPLLISREIYTSNKSIIYNEFRIM